jgi:hypothetical protein
MKITNTTRGHNITVPVKKGGETTFEEVGPGETKSVPGIDMDHATVKGHILSGSLKLDDGKAKASDVSSGIKTAAKPASGE